MDVYFNRIQVLTHLFPMHPFSTSWQPNKHNLNNQNNDMNVDFTNKVSFMLL